MWSCARDQQKTEGRRNDRTHTTNQQIHLNFRIVTKKLAYLGDLAAERATVTIDCQRAVLRGSVGDRRTAWCRFDPDMPRRS